MATQTDILIVIEEAHKEGLVLDMDQLSERLKGDGYSVGSKQSLQCSIGFLEDKGLVVRDHESRRGKRRRLVRLVV